MSGRRVLSDGAPHGENHCGCKTPCGQGTPGARTRSRKSTLEPRELTPLRPGVVSQHQKPWHASVVEKQAAMAWGA